MDQLSGVFLQPLGHVERVEAVAMAGKETALRERAASFTTHATEMEKVCSKIHVVGIYQIRCLLSLSSFVSWLARFKTGQTALYPVQLSLKLS